MTQHQYGVYLARDTRPEPPAPTPPAPPLLVCVTSSCPGRHGLHVDMLDDPHWPVCPWCGHRLIEVFRPG